MGRGGGGGDKERLKKSENVSNLKKKGGVGWGGVGWGGVGGGKALNSGTWKYVHHF